MGRLLLVLGCAFLLLAFGLPSPAARYVLTGLGVPGEAGSEARDINDLGQVIGGNSFDPFLWDPIVGMRYLTAPTGYTAHPYAVNNAGHAAGLLWDKSARISHQAEWHAPDGWRQLPALPGGSGGYARGINNAGQIVGSSGAVVSGLTVGHAFLWDTATGVRDLAPDDTSFSEAEAINDPGSAVGRRSTKTGPTTYFEEGVLWTPDSGMRVLWSGTGAASATDINSLGQVVGYNEYDRGYIWDSVSGARRIGMGWYWVSPQAINDAGQVVGWGTRTYYDHHQQAFIWTEAEGPTYLNDLIPAGTGWMLKVATDINNRGQIVGWGFNPLGQQEAFLLTPIPEPSSLAALALALAGLASAFVRRRRG